MLRLPREGITLEYLVQPVTGIFLNPVIAAALLAATIKQPERTQLFLTEFLRDTITLPTLKSGLKLLLGAAVLRTANAYLSRLALNNWTFDKTWAWDREVVLVTGGSSGIGEKIVHDFASRGIKVASLDVQEPRTPLPTNAYFFKADITSPQAIKEVAKDVRERLGDPTVLVNNAGIGSGETIFAESDTMLEKTFQVNTIAHFHLVREFLPYMVKRNHGQVVTIASMSSFAAIANNVAYSCTKASALAFNEGLAQELRHRYNAPKVRTTVVHPFWTRTPLIEDLTADSHFKKLVLEPETIADAVVQQVLKAESAQIILPARLAALAGLLRGLPSWVQEGVRDAEKSLMDRDAILRRRGLASK